MIASVKMPLDIWSIIDLVSALMNCICFEIIGGATPDKIIIISQKQHLDNYVIVVLIMSWIRFFSYFLVIRTISKLLLTLFRMINDAVSFIFIVMCYLLISATIFTTLFENIDQADYGGLAITVRMLYDAMLGTFVFEVGTTKDLSFSILMMVHVFIANIFLINYLIAILSTVYSYMTE